MIHGTHSVFGMALMETILVAEHAPISWQAGAAIVLAGLCAPLPDLDHPESWVARHLPPLGWIGRFFQHRTFTHSLLMSFALYVLLFGVFHVPAWVATGIWVGWISHWVIDLFNPMGVRLFYPARLWVRQPLSVDVNGVGERIIHFACQVYAVLLVLLYPITLGMADTSLRLAILVGAAVALASPKAVSRVVTALGSAAVAGVLTFCFADPLRQAVNALAAVMFPIVASRPLAWIAQVLNLSV